MAVKVLGNTPPPLQEPIVNPKTGMMTTSWANYFMRLPFSLGNADSLIATNTTNITTNSGAITTLDSRVDAIDTTLLSTPLRLNTVELSAQAASIGATDFSGGTLAAGLYLATYYARITQAATVSSSLIVTLGWTDGAVAQSYAGAAIIGNTTADSQSGTILLRSGAAEAVTYATTYVSVGATAMEYSLDVVLLKVDA